MYGGDHDEICVHCPKTPPLLTAPDHDMAMEFSSGLSSFLSPYIRASSNANLEV